MVISVGTPADSGFVGKQVVCSTGGSGGYAERALVDVGGHPLALVLIGLALHVESYHSQFRRMQASLDRLMQASERMGLAFPNASTITPALSLFATIAASEQILSQEAEVGFHLVLDFTKPYGFDPEKTLPTRQWLTTKLRTLDRGVLTDLLNGTVQALQGEIPGLGDVVSFDVKHIYAWVQENNVRVSVVERYEKTKRLAGGQAEHQPGAA